MQNFIRVGVACALLFQVACDDETTVPMQGFDSTVSTEDAAQGELTQDSGTPSRFDATIVEPVEPDMAVDQGAPEEDAEVAVELDAEVPEEDAEPPAVPLDAGPDCDESQPCAEADHVCREGVCRFDLSPQVYRMTMAEVVEPRLSANMVQGALQLAISGDSLNLLFEAGGGVQDQPDQTWFFVGNGIAQQGAFRFNHTLPIQNFAGTWHSVEDRREWRLEGENVPFVLTVPSGDVMVDEVRRQCYTRFAPIVEVRMWPDFYEGVPVLKARATGVLSKANADEVSFNFSGSVFNLGALLNEADLNVDTDEDGVADAYPFDLIVTAEPVPFNDDRFDGSNRNPTPPDPSPAECNE